MLLHRLLRPQFFGGPLVRYPGKLRGILVLWGVLLLAGFSSSLGADDVPPVDLSRLSVQRIFEQGDLNARRAGGEWLPDGISYSTLEPSALDPGTRDIVRHDVETGEMTVLVPGGWLRDMGRGEPLAVESYQFSPGFSHCLIYTNSRRVWRTHSRGDYWVIDLTRRLSWQLAGDIPAASMMFAKFSPDARFVAYVVNGEIYVEEVRTRVRHQVTHKAHSHIIHGTFDWVYEEEFQIRDGFRWSPDGKSLAFWRLDTSQVPTFTMVNNTDTPYPRLIQFAHPKVGERNAVCDLGIVDLSDFSTIEGSVSDTSEAGAESMSGSPSASSWNDRTRWIDIPDRGDDYIPRMDWLDDSHHVVLQQLNRLQNQKRLLLADLEADSTIPLVTESDAAWVDVDDEMFWFDHHRQFTWIRETDGWRQVYVGSRSGGPLRRVTSGEYDVIQLLQVNEAQGTIYFIASPHHATQRYLFEARLDGSGSRRVTPAEETGTHEYRIAPEGRYAWHEFSTMASPPRIELIELPSHRVVRVIENNDELRERLAALKIAPPQFFQVDIGNSVVLDGWSIQPSEPKAGEKLPLLVHVYGEPAGSTVVDKWGGNQYLWHQMLAQQGYVVMSFDNRGTQVPRGRHWRKSIYRQVGIQAPNEQAAAVRQVLTERSDLDASRVGIWGWSGGGSMSLNALFKFPDVYKMGIAIAPVPNQLYYDTIYQERYMGLPHENADGYRDGSPINFAHQLRGALLLVHGTGDDNCHYQTTEMLINELVHYNKTFQMFAYPNRSHGIHEGKNTTLHLREMMTKFILENL